MKKDLLSLLGFVLLILGFVSLVLSIVGIRLSMLAFLDYFSAGISFLLKICITLLGFVLIYASKIKN